MKNVLVGQSGGPTAVINSSLAGVYETAKACGAPHVYGMQYGIEGVLEGKLIDLDTVLGDKMDIELLKRTPSSFLGSCRHKLPDPAVDDRSRLCSCSSCSGRTDIGAVFYIGGNDSMDTISKLSAYGKTVNSEIRFIGVPKTIDNDLMLHRPHARLRQRGEVHRHDPEGSHLRFQRLRPAQRDGGGDHGPPHRLAGCGAPVWLPGRTATGPDLILLPECPFDEEAFLASAWRELEKERHNRHHRRQRGRQERRTAFSCAIWSPRQASWTPSATRPS